MYLVLPQTSSQVHLLTDSEHPLYTRHSLGEKRQIRSKHTRKCEELSAVKNELLMCKGVGGSCFSQGALGDGPALSEGYCFELSEWHEGASRAHSSVDHSRQWEQQRAGWAQGTGRG